SSPCPRSSGMPPSGACGRQAGSGDRDGMLCPGPRRRPRASRSRRTMQGENLTRAEAEERAALVGVESTDIELDLTRGPTTFGSTTTLRFRAAEGASTFVDAITDRVHAVRLNGRDLDPAEVSDGVRIRLTVTAPENWQVVSNQPTPEPEPVAGGTARWSFAATPRLSSYLVALVAGPYAVRRGELTSSDGRTVPLGAFTRRSLEPYLDAD